VGTRREETTFHAKGGTDSMKRWFVGVILVGALVASASALVAQAQPAPTESPMASPMASTSPTPMTTMQP
jgi:hypothetical protein